MKKTMIRTADRYGAYVPVVVFPSQGLLVPPAVQATPPIPLNLISNPSPIITPVEEAMTTLCRNFPADYKYRPTEATKTFEDALITCDIAEILLNSVLNKPYLLQRFFATGGNNVFGQFVSCIRGFLIPMLLRFDDLWNLDLLRTIFCLPLTDAYGNVPQNCMGFPPWVHFDAYRFFGLFSRIPLLALSSMYNICNIPTQENLVQMAYKICDDFNINPASCCSEDDFGFTHESRLQFSSLTEQVIIHNTIPFCGKGGGVRYHLQRVTDPQGNTAFLPVRNVCCCGAPVTRPSYIRPDKPLFLYQDEIEKNDRRVILLTSQLNLAASLPPTSTYIFTSAWRLQDYASEEEQKLNWTVFRGRTVYYLFFADKAHYNEEFNQAMNVCNRIKQSGSGHPYIFTLDKGEQTK